MLYPIFIVVILQVTLHNHNVRENCLSFTFQINSLGELVQVNILIAQPLPQFNFLNILKARDFHISRIISYPLILFPDTMLERFFRD
uniref:Uncharacterized protein n=1 Tax=Anguilla anguilla TaxID=7936 RepID=A0A0E9SNJ9_ANGAN